MRFEGGFFEILICFTVAYLTNAAGLSLSLGAFIAGLVIGESEYSLDALSDILPFRDLFAGIFFLSIGMLLDTRVILSHLSIVAWIIVTIFGVKFMTGWLSVASIGLPPRAALFAGLSLCQIGEFSFVLAKSGLESDLIPMTTYQIFLSGAIVTMAATPFLMQASQPITGFLYRRAPPEVPEGKGTGGQDARPELSGHAVVAGFGPGGSAVARAAEIAGIQCLVIDLDPDAAKREREKGTIFLYGDATREEFLRHAGIERAAVLFVAIGESKQAEMIVRRARRLAPALPIIAMAGSVDEVVSLSSAGADEVISSEYEGALRLFSRALARFGIAQEEIENLLSRIRTHTIRGITQGSRQETVRAKTGVGFESHHVFRVPVKEGAEACGKTLGELEEVLPPGVSLVGLLRNDTFIAGISRDSLVHEGDSLVFYGPPGRSGEVTFLVLGNG